MYRKLAVVQQKKYSYLTRFKNVAFHAKFFYALRRRGPHHVVCLRAPTILNPPLTTDDVPKSVKLFLRHLGCFVTDTLPEIVRDNDAVMNRYVHLITDSSVVEAIANICVSQTNLCSVTILQEAVLKLDTQSVVELRMFFAKKSIYSKCEMKIMKLLPVFHTYSNDTVSVNSHAAAPTRCDLPFDVLKSDLVNLSTPGSEMLGNHLHIEIVSVPQLLTKDILPKIASYKAEITDRIADFIIKKYMDYCDEESFCTTVAHAAFIKNNHGVLTSPGDLFDPSIVLLQKLFAEEDVFPHKKYHSDLTLAHLKKMGLKGVNDLNASDILRVAKAVEQNEKNGEKAVEIVSRKSKSTAILEYLNINANTLTHEVEGCTLNHEVGRCTLAEHLIQMCWLPASRERCNLYPLTLPFYNGPCFVKPSGLYSPADVLLIGSNSAISELKISAVLQKELHLPTIIPLTTMLKHLESVIVNYTSDEKAAYLMVITQIYDKLFSNYVTEEIVNGITQLDLGTWLWNGDGFSSPAHITIEPPFIDMKPYIWPLQAELVVHRDHLLQMGIIEKCDSYTYINVLHKLSESFPVCTCAKKLELSIVILNELSESNDIIDLTGVPLPIETSKSVYDTKLFEECTYCDTEWLRKGYNEVNCDDGNEEVYFIHSKVSIKTAKKIGIRTLSSRIVHADDFGESGFGQHESLTSRLHGLLKEYTDGFSVFKELVQIADDAGASEVVFIYDERQNQNNKTYLLPKNMKTCQGPTLWAYNNALFTDNDFTSISQIGCGSKAKDYKKIGKFGLGFNSVYNLTDVPSIMSREFLVILDPHLTHLDGSLTGNQPGIKLNLKKNHSSVKRFCDQFQPYVGVLGCDLSKPQVHFDGTLIRLPLRTAIDAEQSEISNKVYGKDAVLKLLQKLLEGIDNILLFTSHVKSVALLHIPQDETNPGNAIKLLSYRKDLHSKMSNSTVNSSAELISQVEKRITNVDTSSDTETNLLYSKVISVTEDVTKACCSLLGEQVQSKSTQKMWLITSASGTKQSLDLTALYPEEALLPVASIAISVRTNDDKSISVIPIEGKLFCYLPLSIKTGLPVHVHAPFCLQSNRRHLITNTCDDIDLVGAKWNEALLSDVVCQAYMHSLRILFTFSNKNENFFGVWPKDYRLSELDVIESFITWFYNFVLEAKDVPLCRQDDHLVLLNEAVFLHQNLRCNGEMSDIFEKLFRKSFPHQAVLEAPIEILHLMCNSDKQSIIEQKIFTFVPFYVKVVLQNKNDIEVKVWDKLMLYALENTFEQLQTILESTAFLPVTTDTTSSTCFRQPSELFDPRSDLLQIMFLGENVFPSTSYRSDVILGRLIELGMKTDHSIDANDLLNIARSIEKQFQLVERENSFTTLIAKAHSIINVLKARPSLFKCIIGEQTLADWLSSITWLPTLTKAKEQYPTTLPFYDGPSFVKSSDAYTEDQMLLIGSNSPICEACINLTIGNSLGLRKNAPLDRILQHLSSIINCYTSTEKSTYLISIVQIYKVIFRHKTDDILHELETLDMARWLWNGQGFSKPGNIVVEVPFTDLQPYIWTLPPELNSYQNDLIQCGMTISCGSDVLIGVLHEINNDGNGKVSGSIKLKLSIAILNELSSLDESLDLNGVPLPVLTDDSVYTAKPWEECTYCDVEWLRKGHSDFNVDTRIHFLHPMISMATAKALSVVPLISRIVKCEDDFCISAFGQHEVLTDRLRGLLTEYTDGFAIFKELLQNADDAGAHDVVFIYDERSNSKYRKCLFNENLKHCQGPALWAYNDATFTDADFQNITRLGSASKSRDKQKIGKFGLGFNSVYNMTDVPSIVSREFFVVFDPQMKYLDKLGNQNSPGIKLDVTRNISMINRFSDQFHPYKNVLGCDFNMPNFRFNGTLLRLPLRSAVEAETSKISQLCYNKAEMMKLLNMLKDGLENLLLFVSNVQSVRLLHIPDNEDDPANAVEIFSLNKKFIQSGPYSNVNTRSQLHSQVPLLSTGSSNDKEQHIHSEVIALKRNVYSQSSLLLSGDCNFITSHWLITHTHGCAQSLKLSEKHPHEGFLPIAGVAIQIQYDGLNQATCIPVEGKLFCYLPLALRTGLYVHIHAPFALQSNRRHIVTKTADDKQKLNAVWNDSLMCDAVCQSYQYSLMTLFTFFVGDGSCFDIWPISIDSFDADSIFISQLTGAFFRSILQSFKFPICRYQGHIIHLQDALFLHPELQKYPDIWTDCKVIFRQTMPTLAVLDVPKPVLSQLSNNGLRQHAIFTRHAFYEDVVFKFFDRINITMRTKLILHAVETADATLEALLQKHSCIPNDAPGKSLKMPSELFDPKVPLLQRLFDGDHMFPHTDFQSYQSLECLRRIGMKEESEIDAVSLLNVAEYIDRINNDTLTTETIKTCCAKSSAIMEVLNNCPELLKQCVDKKTFKQNLLELNWLPTIRIPSKEYPKYLPFFESRHFMAPSEVYSISKMYVVGSITPFIEVNLHSCLVQLFEIHNVTPLSSILNHLLNVVNYYNSGEKSLYMTIVISIYEELFSCYEPQIILNCLKEMEFADWLWNGDGFSSPGQITDVLEYIELKPYIWQVPPELKKFQIKLQQCGIIKHYNPCVYVKVLRELSISDKKVNCEKKLQLSVSVLNKLCEFETVPMLAGVPIPVQTKDHKYATELWENCTYCDIEWLRRSHDNDSNCNAITFIHPSISMKTAELLNVCPLINRTLQIEKDGLESFGQHESLTRRLHGLLKEYTDGFAIFKELIQNADDAGATEVVFIYDERQNKDHMQTLLHTKMKNWQGPALWVYNDAHFTCDDFKNLSNLGASSKATDSSKIGKFGLGFNSVYNLTDVPSILSNEYLVILDPHRLHLGKAHRDPSQPGIKINLKKSLSGALVDQFHPYLNVMGFDLNRCHFDGTLFRLPLRTELSACSSEIRDSPYTRNKMITLLTKLTEGMTNMLLFTTNVSTVKVLHIPASENDPSKAIEMCCYTKTQTDLLKTSSKICLAEILRDISSYPFESFKFFCTSICLSKKISPACNHLLRCNGMKNKDCHWLISYAAGVAGAVEFAKAYPEELFLPYAAVALQVTVKNDGKIIPRAVEGQLVCHLPLAVNTGLPVHINAPFSLQSNRRDIVTQSTDDILSLHAQWNKMLFGDPICEAYLYMIKILFIYQSENISVFQVWPICKNAADCMTLLHDQFITPFYNALINDPTFPICRINNSIITLQDAQFLHAALQNNEVIGKICKKTFCDALPEKAVLRIPQDIIEFLNITDSQFVKSKMFTTWRFFKEILFERILLINSTHRNALVIYALTELYAELRGLLKEYPYVPVQGSDELKIPSDLVHPCSHISNLFDDSDHRTPVSPFTENNVTLRLVQLGMQKDSLRWEDVLDRALSIKHLLDEPTRMHTRQRNLLSYMDEKISCTEASEIEEWRHQFLTVKFLSSLSQSGHQTCHVKCDTSVKSLLAPAEMYSNNLKDLCSAKRKIHKCSTTLQVEQFLGIITTAPPTDVLYQLNCLIECPRCNLDNERQVLAIYSYFDDLCNDESDEVGEIITILARMKCIYICGVFVPVESVSLSNVKSLEPWLYQLPLSIKKFKKLIEALNIKKSFGLHDYIYCLSRIKESFTVNPIDDKTKVTCLLLLNEVAQFVKSDNPLDVPEISEIVYVPDNNGVMTPHTELLYNNSYFGKSMFVHKYTHRSISVELADRLGIAMLRTHISSNLADGISFGQSEALTNILGRILKNYPRKEIAKELIQNSDDAGSSHINFICDYKMHGDKYVFSDTWKQLQGPALCVYSNTAFTKEDIANIQKLGDSDKQKDSSKIGQYGIGFNTVYHLTDVPTIITYNKEGEGSLCIFDPNLEYAPGATEAKPGQLFTGKSLQCVLGEFSDLKDAHLLHIEKLTKFNPDFTILRLPLRNQTMANCSKISQKCVTTRDIEDLFVNITDDAFDLLLFTSCLTEINLHKLHIDDQYLQYYCIASKVDQNDTIQLRKYQCMVKRVAKELKTRTLKIQDVQRQFLKYTKILSDTRGVTEKWLIYQSVGFDENDKVPEDIQEAFESEQLCLTPTGSIAVLLEQTRNGSLTNAVRKNRAFCVLPLPIETGLPIQINARFAMNYENRQSLSFSGVEGSWNRLLCQQFIAPLYCKMICSMIQTYHEVNVDINKIDHMLAFFPLFLESEWDVLVQEFYNYMCKMKLAIIPVKMILPNSELLFKWMPIQGDGKQELFFTGLPSLLNGEATDDLLPHTEKIQNVLVNCGLPIAHMTETLQTTILKAIPDIKLVTPEIVTDFLRSFIGESNFCGRSCLPISLKNSIFKEKSVYVLVLRYCLCHTEFLNKLEGLPLLLTADMQLRKFSRRCPVYASKYYRLLPSNLNLFVHKDLLKLAFENCNIDEIVTVKRMDVSGFVELFRYTELGNTFCSQNTITFNWSEQKGWFQYLWKFLVGEYSEANADEYFSHLQEFCFVPVTIKTKYFLHKVTATPSVVDTRRQITNNTYDSNGMTDIVGKLDVCVLDWGNMDSHLSSETSKFISEFPTVTSLNNADDILQIIHSQLKQEQLYKYECAYLLRYFNDRIDMIQPKHIFMLEDLPYYLTLHGDLISLSSSYVYVIPAGIPQTDIDILRNKRDVVFLSKDLELEKLYQTIGCKLMTVVDFYCEFILNSMHFELLSHVGQMVHLKFLWDHYFSVQRKSTKKAADREKLRNRNRLLTKCKDLYFIHDKNPDDKHQAREYFDPNNGVFELFCADRLPPKTTGITGFSESSFHTLLRELGMQCEVTDDMFIEFAQSLCQQHRPTSLANKRLVLINHLFQKRDPNKYCSLYQQIGKIRFLSCGIVAKELSFLCEQHQKHANNPLPKISCNGSVLRDQSSLCWTNTTILPDWFPSHKKEVYYEQLGIMLKPSIDDVVNHLRKLVDRLCESDQRYNVACFDTFKKIYQFMQQNDLKNSVSLKVAKQTPFVIMLQRKTIVPAINTVIELSMSEEIPPYLYKVPNELGEFCHLFKQNGATEKVTQSQYVKVLHGIYESTHGKKLGPSEIQDVYKAVRGFFTAVEETSCSNIPLCLLNHQGIMHKANHLFYNNIPAFYNRLLHSNDVNLMVDPKICGLMQQNFDTQILALPDVWRPQLISDVISEELLSDNIEPCHNDIIIELAIRLKSTQFTEGVARLIRHKAFNDHVHLPDDDIAMAVDKLQTLKVRRNDIIEPILALKLYIK